MINEEEGRVIDLMDYWRVIVRRKNVLIVFAGAIILLVGIFSFAVSPKYKPTATILIGEETSKMLNIENEFSSVAYKSTLQDTVYLNTQLSLLKSVSLAKRVVDKMDLLAHPAYKDLNKSGMSIGKRIKYLYTFKWLKPRKKTDEATPFEDPATEVATALRDSLRAALVRETDIVKVSFISPDPVLGTEIVNTFADEFISYSIDIKYKTTQQARDFLSEQISVLRDELSSKERELQRYSQEKDLRFLSDTESTALNEYSELHKAFATAQVARINAQATFRELSSLDIDTPAQIVSNSMIVNLTTDYARMKNTYEELNKIYGPNHPDMIKRKASLDSMKSNLQDEVLKAVRVAEADYRSALRKENDLRTALSRQNTEVVKMKSDAILYNSLKIEIENVQAQLNSLEEMRKQTEVSSKLAGIRASNISVVDYALVPKSPDSPKKKMNLLLALLIGLSGGIALCFVLDFLDNTIKGSDDLERLVGLPSLGMIPYLSSDGKKRRKIGSRFISSYSYGQNAPGSEGDLPENANIELVNHRHPNFAIAEDYRTVRTSILLSQNSNFSKIIAFSSSLPQEGKTATVANTAVSFAQLGKKVVIIDADLRRPRLHRLFGVRNTKGLTGFLTEKDSIEDIVQKTTVENVWLIPSGPIPPNPAELLESDRMKLLLDGIKKEIDFVLIDTPPVLAVVDSVIIGSLVSNVVLIAQPEKTNRRVFENSVERLKQSNAKIIGVVFNKTSPQTKKYHDKYYYYQDYYTPENQV